MYKELKRIQELLWKDDDYMTQDTLFELQDYVASLLLETAQREGKVHDLVKSFPFLYEVSK